MKPTGKDPQAMAARAFAALARKQDSRSPKSALDYWQRAAALAPSDPTHRLGLAEALERTGDVSGAEREFRKALELQPDSTEAQTALSNFLINTKRPPEAPEAHDVHDVEEPQQLESLALPEQSEDPQPEPVSSVEKTEAEVEEKKEADPESLAPSIQNELPEPEPVLTENKIQEKRDSELESLALEAQNEQPQPVPVLSEEKEVAEVIEIKYAEPENLAPAVVEKKDAEAAEVLQKAPASQTDEWYELRELTFAQARGKEYAAAENNFRNLLVRFPKDAELYEGLGSVLLAQLKYAEAQNKFMACLRIRPEWGEAYGQLAMAAVGNGAWEVALKALDERRKLLEETPITYLQRATCCDHLRRFAEAENNYKTFLATSRGQFPDDELKARRRLMAIEPEVTAKR